MDTVLADKTDEELAALVQGNNAAAFGVLMERYQGKLLRYGRRFLSETASIEDVVQDTFIKAYEHIRSFDTNRSFSPWIYRIAHNQFVNKLREKGRTKTIAVDFDTFAAHPSYEIDPEGDEEREATRKLVEHGLATLSDTYREVLILYYIEQLSYQEIADVLRIPIGTVGIRLHRAKQSLKSHVEGK